MRRFVLILLILYSLANIARAQPVLRIDDSQPAFDTGLWADWLADPTRQLTLAEVTRPAISERFRRVGQRYPNAGYTFDDYWLRVRINVANGSPTDRSPTRLYFENVYPIATAVDLYVLDSTGRLLDSHHATSCSRGDRREVPHPNFVFSTLVRPGQTLTVYVHSHSEMGLQYIPLTIWHETDFANYSTWLHFGWGIYFGFALLALLLHVLIYAFTNERRYLYVGLTVVSYLLYESCRGVGFSARYLWPNNHWLLTHGLNVSFTVWLLAYLVFFDEMLNLRHRAPGWRKAFVTLAVFNCLALLLTLPDWLISRALVPVVQGMVTILAVLVVGILFVRRGQHQVLFYVLGTLALLVGGVLLTLSRSGAVTFNGNMSAMMMSAGSMLEICCLTLGVAAQSRQERRLRQQAIADRKTAEQRTQLEQRQRALADEEASLMALIGERRALADELHDNLGSLLFGLQLRLEGLVNQPAIQPADLQAVLQLVAKSHQRVRLIAHNLMPTELDRQGGLGPALRAFVDELNLASTSTVFGLYVDRHTQTLSPTIQFACYNMAFELMQNVLRHAQATQASIQVRCTDKKTVILAAQDNGVGIPKKTLADSRSFATIRRRTAQVRGQFSVGNDPNGGTRAVVELPL